MVTAAISRGETDASPTRARILVVGGGYVGMYTALHLQRLLRAELRRGAVEIVVVTPEPYMTYQPFLPEAAAGNISPRHVVVPLRRVLGGCTIVIGEVKAVDHAKRSATVVTLATEEEAAGPVEVGYDELVLAAGSISRTLPVPGLADHGIGFKTVEEAIGLRNHVIEQMDIASSTRDPAIRDAALTFVFVGGGFAGVEALGELEDMARYTARYYHNIRPEDLKWVLVEASDRILPEVGEEMGRYTVRELRARNIDVRLETRLESCADRVAVLSDGSRFPTRTVVWTAGVKPAPVIAATDLPLNERGRVRCTARLGVEGVEHAWAAGDAAAVPDVTAEEPGKECAPNAQHALRQSRVLAENIAASLRGRPLKEYAHKYAGSVASLGLHKGVAHVYGRKLKGYPAWFMHRTYHLSRIPTFNRKARVMAEWTLAGLFKREIVSLGSLEHPRAEFEQAAGPPSPPPDQAVTSDSSPGGKDSPEPGRAPGPGGARGVEESGGAGNEGDAADTGGADGNGSTKNAGPNPD
ncbi:NAD(P)/FAD-dependent oxidoreductase [Streptomyces sp. MUM 203J]|uniref:NAD(P)/FAD-dependent oxidoreductase n=1 Tax=Streptomyces sp. MUM 203J TaxID=2791990 RepID=UPI001F034357|nr:NAD(P)/FAD-dependent oxidoreductase [Streptomyces sp. MUM 203J]MCH0543450.1 NAD(P)/FAD-dependent oxidoreductase [Streptomyces sp. MUM 203J]